MNASEQLREDHVQSQASQQQEVKEQVSHQEAQKTVPARTVAGTGQATWRSEVVMSGLEKALDALFKAQDHLNTAADQGGDGLSFQDDRRIQPKLERAPTGTIPGDLPSGQWRMISTVIVSLQSGEIRCPWQSNSIKMRT